LQTIAIILKSCFFKNELFQFYFKFILICGLYFAFKIYQMKNMNSFFDVIIIGAGPAGCSTALSLSKSNLKVAVFDKEIFPRKKTCGDALSIDVVNQLRKISSTLYSNFLNLAEKTPINGIKIYSPNNNKVEVTYDKTIKNAYVCSRFVFDNFMVQEVKNLQNITLFENEKVNNVIINNDFVEVISSKNTYKSNIIVVANGAYSLISKKLLPHKINSKAYTIAAQVYFSNVKFEDNDKIELHFLENILPAYFWIFPSNDNIANIGFGMLASDIKKRKINLKNQLNEIIKDERFAYRFAEAEQTTEILTHGLPLAMTKKNISGNRFLLIGDAASLINPLTGEGIGNAIRSGRIAANHIISCQNDNNYSQKYNKKFDKSIYSAMWKEIKFDVFLQKLVKYPKLLNWGVKKAQKGYFFSNKLNY